MKIIVCIKSVATHAPEGQIARSPDLVCLNPFDRPALELALGFKEKLSAQTIAFTMGPDTAELALYEALSLGIDRAVHLSDGCLSGCDTLATSTALAAGIRGIGDFDLLLFGLRSSDSDTGQVGPQTATGLDIPLITNADSLEISGRVVKASRICDGYREVFETDLPAAATVHHSAANPRDISLHGLEAAFSEGKIERLTVADLGLSQSQVGLEGSGTKLLSMRRVKRERKCRMLEGSADEQAEALVKTMVDSGLVV